VTVPDSPFGLLAVQLMIVVPGGCWIARLMLVKKTAVGSVVQLSLGQPTCLAVALGADCVLGPIVLPPGPKKARLPFLTLPAETVTVVGGRVKGTLFWPGAVFPLPGFSQL